MALVQCPECGRDNVSDTAIACPECGFNVKQYVEEVNTAIEQHKKDEEEYQKIYDSIKVPDEPIPPKKENVPFNATLGIGGVICTICCIGVTGMGGFFWALFYLAFAIISLFVAMVGFVTLSTAEKEYEVRLKFYNEKLHEFQRANEDFEEYRKEQTDKIFNMNKEREERRKKYEEIKEQTHKDERVKCPKCGSLSVGTGSRGWNIWTGMIGSGKTVNRCGKCGYTWSPRRRS